MHPGHPNDPRLRIVPLFYTGNNFVLLDGRWSNPNFISYIPHHYGVFPIHYYPQTSQPIPPLAAYNRYPPPPLLMNPFPQPSRFIHPATSLPPIPPPSRPPSTKSDVSSIDYVTEEQMNEIDEELKGEDTQEQQDKDSGVEKDEVERGGTRRNYATDHEDDDDDTKP